MKPINVGEKLSLIGEHWRSKIVAELNGQQVKLVKVRGEFVWHRHEHADELFWILAGELIIEFRDGPVTLRTGEMMVIPRGVEHRPVAAEEVHMALIEPAGVVNTGDAGECELTAPAQGEWV
jgi:mannose-6-phosphate isomerase-like protein (cupin superfamily)